jgi:class 3 adenylate cyclase
MEFRILGPLEISGAEGAVALGGARQRALLALLLIRANQIVPADVLIDELWGSEVPQNAANALQAVVSRVRKAIGDDRLHSQAPGYVLEIAPGELDLDRFEQLVAEARASLARGDAAGASAGLSRALDLWRGPPLADFLYEPFAQREIARLEELRLAALEERFEADLGLGRHAALVGELEALLAAQPSRERLRAQLMLALYRSGRQAEALDCYQAGRRAAVEELGIEPMRELRDLEAAILRQDPALDLVVAEPEPPARARTRRAPSAPAEPERSARKIVTVLFTDVVGSTELAAEIDAEHLRSVMEQFFLTISAALEQHGGTVEKYMGDAVMAIFGVPSVHEDDALRALRAASEMQQRLDVLNEELEPQLGGKLMTRTGVNTGEVVVGASGVGETLVSGRAVNLAQRLEAAATPGEILFGHETYAHVMGAVGCEAVEPIAVKGFREPVRAWRLVDVPADGSPLPRPNGAPLVGRTEERDLVLGAFEQCETRGSCRLVTVLGPPGIGKSRLVRDSLAVVEGRARVLRGRCLPYGEGITYWALTEVVRELGMDDVHGEIARLLEDDPMADLIADRIVAAAGAGGASGPSEQTHWAVRRALEALATTGPVVVVLDDLHWAEATFLDLVEYLAGFCAGPVLLIAMAREDLLELRPSWGLAGPSADVVRLDPLTGDETRELIEHLVRGRAVGPATIDRIVETAEGNPLFLEQLVAMQAEDPALGDELAVPPTIQALLAARIDRLPDAERLVLELASIEGRVFHRGPLVELVAPEERVELGSSLMALLRRDLIGPGRSDYPGDDAFRFRHILIRDAAYGSLPKQTRAELHMRFADWLERTAAGQLIEQDEIAGYHLEQAHGYQSELRLGSGEERGELARRAAGRLEAAARRALARTDLPAAVNLFERSADLLPADDPTRVAMLPELGTALLEAGRLEDAERVLDEAVVAAGDEQRLALARVQQLGLLLQVDPERALAEFDGVREGALELFTRAGDERGLCRLWRLEGIVRWVEGRSSEADEAWQQAAGHARLAGDERELVDVLAWSASEAGLGPTPAPEAIERCEAIREQVRPDRYAEASILLPLASLQAMRAQFDVATELLEESRAVFRELGLGMHFAAAVSEHEAFVAMLAGDEESAEVALRGSLERLDAIGEKALLSSTAATLAHVLIAQGKLDDAWPLVDVAEEAGAREDLAAQIAWRGARARILAARGELEQAVALAHEAIVLADRTDWLNFRGDARLDLVAVLRAAGDEQGAGSAARAALACYEQKGNVVSAERAAALLEPRATP